MAIIDEEKRQMESRTSSASSSSATPFAIPRSPPPKFQSEASSSIHRSPHFSHYGHPSGYSRLTEKQEHHRENRHGFTYPELIQYIYHLLAIAAILIFVAFTIKAIEFLSLANTLNQQTIQLLNLSNSLLAALLSQPQPSGDQQKLEALLDMAAGVCNSQSDIAQNPACQSLSSLLPALTATTVTSTITPHNVEDLLETYTSYASGTSLPPFQSYSPSSQSYSNTSIISSNATFESSTPTPDQASISSLSSPSASASFAVIVGTIGAVVIAFGIAGGLLYERTERTRARQERREMMEREK